MDSSFELRHQFVIRHLSFVIVMARFAYLFERFPSFGQTFCYREVAELDRQDIAPPIFSIRNPKDEPSQDWDNRIVERVHYLPDEKELLEEVRRAAKKGQIGSDIVGALDEWGRRTDFLRLYQAVHVGVRLQTMGINHVHAHFAGMAARTAFWIGKFFPITFSFTAHANDIFSPRQFEIGLDKLVDRARVVVTETDYAARFLRERFSHCADHVHRIYNGLNLAEFGRSDFSSTPPLIIGVGRLIPKKGFGDLIRACALLVERGKAFRCEIIGEGPLKDELRRQIDAWKDRPLNIRAITAVIDAYIAKPQPGTDRLRIAARREADSTGIILRMHLAPGKEGESLSRMDVEQWVSFSPGFSRNAIGEDRKYGVSRRNWLEFETTARGALSLPVERPIVIAVQVDLSD